MITQAPDRSGGGDANPRDIEGRALPTPRGSWKTAAQQRKRGTPSDDRRGGARTKRRRPDSQAPEGAPVPSQARAGGAGIPL